MGNSIRLSIEEGMKKNQEFIAEMNNITDYVKYILPSLPHDLMQVQRRIGHEVASFNCKTVGMYLDMRTIRSNR
ncbi:hypothetical protein J437_LFUL010731 [Ladona fulva]|uniref:Uncharacterized protein n=1 Tax=Ladona fulva TaxID=123851 RepID=A0A8K0P529_LADFU|nr:hypothetical protein J437_LFUL010731 [Ladona fulva]